MVKSVAAALGFSIGAFGILASPTQAHATSIEFHLPGVIVDVSTSLPLGMTLLDLNPYIGDTNFSVAGYGTFSGAKVYAASDQVPGVRLAPGATGAYIAAQPGHPETITLASSQTSWGEELFTGDLYNNISFSNGVTITGTELAALSGFSFDGVSNYFITYRGMAPFNSVVSDTFQIAQEFRGGASAVPETSTWAMLAIGFASLGYAAYRQRKTPIAAAF